MLGRRLLFLALILGACAVPTSEPTAPEPSPDQSHTRPASDPPVGVPTPTQTPVAVENPFYVGVVLVQDEEEAGFRRVAEADGAILLGHSYSAFGARCSEPTDVAERLAWGGDAPKMLYASLAPEDLDWRGNGCAGSESRLNDDAIEEFARRNLDVAAADPSITHMNFWNELKGYAMPEEMELFADHYIRWSRTIKAERPDLELGGPYTHGGFSDESLEEIHGRFIDLVVAPYPELVDFIASGDSHRPSTFYTDIYADRGVRLRHWQPEWYPGGHAADSAPSVGAMIEELLGKATNPLMEGVIMWGSGPLSSDPNQVVPLWDADGQPSEYWWALIETARFTALGQVAPVSDGVYRNGAGETLTVSEGGVSVDGR